MRFIRTAAACLAACLLAVCVGCSTAPANLQPGGDVLDRVDVYVKTQMQASHIPGLALGILQGNKTVFLKGYGVADASGDAVTVQTPFILASVSKSVTALAILQLADAGLVQLDAPVVQYTPAFRILDGRAAAITVRQLLNQTSGLGTASGNLLNLNNGSKPLDSLVGELSGDALVSEPGSAFHYSNANYVLLADIVEHVTGQSYGDYVISHIFRPLGMRGSSVERTQDTRQRMASGFLYWFGFPRQMQAHDYVPCLNNVSTAEDMTHYLSALMNGGSYEGAQVFSPASLSLMRQPAAKMGGTVSYAMGLEVDTSQPYTVIRHPGDAPGFNANIALLPQGNWGVVVLENCNWLAMEGQTGEIVSGIEKLLEGQQPAGDFFNPAKIMVLFDAVYAIAFFFLVRAFVYLGRWKRKIDGDEPTRLRRRLIPVAINGLMVPACMVQFIPMAFAASWAQGFQNAPDFSLMMLGIVAMLFALGVARAVIVLQRMGAMKKESMSV